MKRQQLSRLAADVKPENVFVDADGVAKLGDFDVSKDDATRVTMAATFVGFSLAYAAPEIKNGGAASKPGDMYAFGLTLVDIVLGEQPIKERPVDVELLACHEPLEGGASLRDIVRRLVDQVAANRITASDALKSPLFAPPAPGRDPDRDRRKCSACLESHWLDEGIECDAEHFVCNGDVEATAQIFCSLAPGVIAKQGALRCQEQGCAAAPWSNASLAQSLSAAQFSAYVEKLREVSENLALVEQRQRHEAELVQLQRMWRGELTRNDEVALHRRHIRDDLLCLRCPRCKSAFVIDDFDSCLAMNCASCKAAFCAWCLRDCGADGHAHVNECERNPTRPRTVFSNAAQFEKAHRERFAKVVGDYLPALRNDEIRAAVREAIRRDLDDLGVVLA